MGIQIRIGVGIDFTRLLNREKELLQLLLHAPEHLDTIVENISPDQFVEGPLKRLYTFIDECFQGGDEISFESLMLNVEDSAIKNVLVFLDEEWHQMQVWFNVLTNL